MNPELISLKNRFPFRLGCTSYVLPDHILPNVGFLADKVDGIELLLFEDDETSNYPTPEEIKRLNEIAAEHNLAYSVHLPLYQKLGSRNEAERTKGRDAILRAVDATRALNPFAFDLHLEPDQYDKAKPVNDLVAWQDQHRKSLTEMIARGLPNKITGVETLEYPFEWVDDIVFDLNFNVCLDIGHVWLMNYDADAYLEKYLPRVRNVHLHGVENGKDHRSLDVLPPEQIARFFNALAAVPRERMVCVEVFGIEKLHPSLQALKKRFA
ncbi:cobamide remodeling phosphodiesterase CbiR [Verrucomicrobiota bacterium]